MLVVAALVAATPAHAQKLSLADRVARLELQANNTQANQDLLNQLDQLRTEVQALREAVEQLQHENQQLQQRSRDQYLDLDGRLNRLEGGALPAPPATAGTDAAASAPAAPAAPVDTAPRVYGDPGSLAQFGDERAAYNTAFEALKAARYDESAQLFQAFLEAFPAGIYAANALYWLGESYYATGNYRLAEEQFQALVGRYPTHDKAAGALLKAGLSQFGDRRVAEAESTLQQVISRYPGTDAARIAGDRLHSIQIGQLR
ncbi:tol-pal system protein YbgF [Pseudoxanthomonas sp. J35]|uniref:tol-pal system protein YbgF n=1 Tax=Pseudoxanthomonas sp. J35 TaxID=935852 RepID=UPI00048FC242|nr:tol-pal system protein YbgF [Pseudoxanthomonas sp. J35]